MFGMLKRPPKPVMRLARLLADYPPLRLPHIGRNGCLGRAAGPILTLDQCRDNFDAYQAEMPARLVLLHGALAVLGIDSATAYDDPVGFVTRLHPALLAELPPLYRPEIATHAAWEISDKSGRDIVLSFIGDLAMLTADVLMRARPGCFLGLNLSRAERNMFKYRRPCLLGLGDRMFPGSRQVYYLEEEWFGYYANMDRPSRLAAPDRVVPAAYGMAIGGTLLTKLERNVFVPGATEELGPA